MLRSPSLRGLRALGALAVVTLAACSDSGAPTRPTLAPGLKPALTVSDANSGGRRGFYFMAPIQPTLPSYPGTFDRNVTATARICPTPGNCAAPLATFTVGGAPGSAITVDAARQVYTATWAVPSNLTLGTGNYRLEVLAAGATLGFADLNIVATTAGIGTTPSGFVGAVRGANLTVRFRIETNTVGLIDVAPANASVAVGGTKAFAATVYDLYGVPMANPAVTWSSNTAIATLNPTSGPSTTATGVAVGTTAITASSGGASGSTSLTVTTAKPTAVADSYQGSIGQTLTVPTSSGLLANDDVGAPAATVASFGGGSLGGTVTSNAAGSSVPMAGGTLVVNAAGDLTLTGATTAGAYTFQYRLANAGGTSDAQVSIVVLGTGPQILSITPSPMVPGTTATITGVNFSATAASNTVTIGGVTVTVSSATTTSLQVTVPCIASGSKNVQVTVGADASPLFPHPLVVANQRTVGIGQAVIVTDASQVACNELPATGVPSRYLVAVYSNSSSPTSNAPFQFRADAAATSVPATVLANAATGRAMQGLLVGPRADLAAAQQEQAQDARHTRLLEQNAQAYQQLSARFRNDRRMRPTASLVAGPVTPPTTRTFRVSNINAANICASYYVVSATRVYYNGKVAIYEDDATPVGLRASDNATVAASYQKIGDQFNSDMEPIIRNNFGDPLRRDAITDNNGAVVALFTPRINNSFSGVAGFVVSCDQFPNDDSSTPAVGGPYTGSAGSTNGASNFGEFFYAYQPTVVGSGYGSFTPDQWYRTIRSTFIHETKHVASMAARVANNASAFEASWLEEGTARHAEELWMRNAVDNQGWKTNIGYGSFGNPINVYCDVRPGFAECDANSRRPASIMQRHFGSLYTFLFGQNARLLSPFGPTPSDNASYFYAVSWSLVRYAIDRYGASDAAFLTSLTQSTTSGTDNLTARAGVSLDQLLGGWALALVADDHPALAGPPSPTIQMPTWNFRSIYAGLNADFPSTYTVAYPGVPTAFSFGGFTATGVTTLRGGGVLWYELSGTQTAPQVLNLTGNGGGAAPSSLRLAITRLQ